jgi:hypothetical protein
VLSSFNWYQSRRRSSESGAWGSSWCRSTQKRSLKAETRLPPLIRSDSQSRFNLVTASGWIKASLTVADKSSQAMPALACAGNQWLAQTAALLQNWRSAAAAQLFVNGIPQSSVKPNSCARGPKGRCRVDRKEVMASRVLVPS